VDLKIYGNKSWKRSKQHLFFCLESQWKNGIFFISTAVGFLPSSVFLKKNVMISKNCLIHFDAIIMKSLKSSLNGEYWNFQLTINPMANITVSCTDCTR